MRRFVARELLIHMDRDLFHYLHFERVYFELTPICHLLPLRTAFLLDLFTVYYRNLSA